MLSAFLYIQLKQQLRVVFFCARLVLICLGAREAKILRFGVKDLLKAGTVRTHEAKVESAHKQFELAVTQRPPHSAGQEYLQRVQRKQKARGVGVCHRAYGTCTFAI